ncbi:hypothetical protein [Actinoallomurus sp. NPDC052274]|uniref:hypothetical protein n=1 Tax=Actinoallomurus sp. NPDC052274 TaxID=3155420 RepID=UPI003441EACB
MGIDHTTAGSDNNSETVEHKSAADNRPPPPPDKPGSDGYPSRADSRAGAAAANNTDQPTTADKREQQNSGSTDASAESPKGENSEAAEKDTPAGTQPNEAAESPTKDTDATPWAGSGTRSERTGEGSAQQPDEATESANETGRTETSPNSRATTTETAASADRSSAAGEVGQQDEKKGTTDRPAAENDSQAKPDADAAGSPEVSRTSASDATTPQESSSASAADGLPPEASPGMRPEAAPDESRNEPGRSTDTAVPTVDEAGTSTGERVTATNEGTLHKQSEAAESAPQADGDAPFAPDNQRLDHTTSKTDAATGAQKDEGPVTTDQPHELAESVGSADGSEPAGSSTEHAPEIRAAQSSEGDSGDEAGTPDEEPEQAASPWKYDIRVQDVPLEAYLNRPDGRDGSPDERDPLLTEDPLQGEKPEELPTGEELRDMDSDKLSRFDRIRKSALKNAGDILDKSKEYANLGHDVLGRPPTGSHAQVRGLQPEVANAPHDGASVGDLITGVMVAGLLLGEGGRRLHRGLLKKGNSSGGNG